MVERPHEFVLQRQRQHRIAQRSKAATWRGHEAGAFTRLGNDFARRSHALGAVIGQQRGASQSPDHIGQMPAQRLRILKGGVGPAHAKNRQQMRRIASEDGAPLYELGQGQGAGRIDR